jgi:hypothetical protein
MSPDIKPVAWVLCEVIAALPLLGYYKTTVSREKVAPTDAALYDQSAIDTLQSRIAELEAEAVTLRERSAFYLWLRNECADTPIGVFEWSTNDDGRQRRVWLAGDELDDTIRAAIAAQGGK